MFRVPVDGRGENEGERRKLHVADEVPGDDVGLREIAVVGAAKGVENVVGPLAAPGPRDEAKTVRGFRHTPLSIRSSVKEPATVPGPGSTPVGETYAEVRSSGFGPELPVIVRAFHGSTVRSVPETTTL